MRTKKYIVSYGAGVDSTAMLILLKNLGKPVDYILFADTGGERPETYSYIQYFNLWLIKNGLPEIITVKYRTKYDEQITLEEEVLKNHTLPAIAFGWKTCSHKYKVFPIEKWLKSNVDFGNEKPVKYLGYESGEERRMKPDPNGFYINEYPLIEYGCDRKAAEEIIVSEGLCVPSKSSCFYCPSMKKHEILSLSKDLQERAMAIEANATRVAELKGLGRYFSWTDLIKADEAQRTLFDDVEMYQTPCECVD